jgi:hypothetical protein
VSASRAIDNKNKKGWLRRQTGRGGVSVFHFLHQLSREEETTGGTINYYLISNYLLSTLSLAAPTRSTAPKLFLVYCCSSSTTTVGHIINLLFREDRGSPRQEQQQTAQERPVYFFTLVASRSTIIIMEATTSTDRCHPRAFLTRTWRRRFLLL